jgi:DNA-binding CsgD family transcriptional regulator
MKKPTSRVPDREPGPTIVVCIEDAAQLRVDPASFVDYLKRFDWGNRRPGIEVVVGALPEARSIARERRVHAPPEHRRPHWHVTDAGAESAREPGSASHSCTGREREILELLRHGLSNKEIAQRLGIVEETVKKHLQHIYDKFGVRRRALIMLAQAGVWTIRRGPSFS